MSHRIIVSVSNDMSTDQRVDKTCRSLMSVGYEVKVICRQRKDSLPLDRPYQVERMKLWFDRGPLFYLEFNVRLFLKLLSYNPDILLANDLDTLMVNYMAYASRRADALVYDSHEYFTEVPELRGRWARKVWLKIERFIFPKLRHVYTVNQNIADIYSEAYNVPVKVIRNLPDTRQIGKPLGRQPLGLPEDKHILILQGAGINVDRGAAEAVEAMQLLSDTFLLLIIGAGDVVEELKQRVIRDRLEAKVWFKDRMPYEQMMQYTCAADIGLSLDKPGSGNYDNSLPNKVFDALAAGLPLIVGPTRVVANLVEEYELGEVLAQVTPSNIAAAAERMLSNPEAMQQYCVRAADASKNFNWEGQEPDLLRIFAVID